MAVVVNVVQPTATKQQTASRLLKSMTSTLKKKSNNTVILKVRMR